MKSSSCLSPPSRVRCPIGSALSRRRRRHVHCAGKISARRVFVHLQIGAGPRRSPSAWLRDIFFSKKCAAPHVRAACARARCTHACARAHMRVRAGEHAGGQARADTCVRLRCTTRVRWGDGGVLRAAVLRAAVLCAVRRVHSREWAGGRGTRPYSRTGTCGP